jgi:alkanesulfonate monooxygenase SsuD/methylene tetrahydromethanopterin reductase-like flavin-dependent oxidoreductase (luciferase family)
MRFITITLIVHAPDPVTGEQKSTQDRFTEVLGNARLAEELGFDGFGVGERHERPFISSAPTVVLSHVAALTTRIRLFTAVTTLSLLDPVRAFEDYATLDHLSGGRLELIIGKGNGAAQRDLFHVTPQDQWHGSATSKESVDLAARYGDPLFSANVTNSIEPYAELIRYYRERWAHYGHDPAAIAVGAGTAGYYATRNSQDAIDTYRPVFAGYLAFQERLGVQPVFPTLEDFTERSSALIGSPAQVIEKVHRYHQQFGHSLLHLHADAGGLTDAQHRASLELFQSDIAPVLRREIPDPPWGWGGGPVGDDATPAPAIAVAG